MRLNSSLALAAASAFIAVPRPASTATPPASFIYETPHEFFGTGDFDGDGRKDFVIVDKQSGKFRLGYQLPSGVISWVDNRPSGIKAVSGFSIGKLQATNRDSLIFTSPDANQLTIVDVSSPTAPAKPVVAPFDAALGPNSVLVMDIGGAGRVGFAALYVSS